MLWHHPSNKVQRNTYHQRLLTLFSLADVHEKSSLNAIMPLTMQTNVQMIYFIVLI